MSHRNILGCGSALQAAECFAELFGLGTLKSWVKIKPEGVANGPLLCEVYNHGNLGGGVEEG